MIRPVNISDLDDIYALYQQLHADQELDKSLFKRKMEELLDNNHICLIGYEVNNNIVSSCMVVKVLGLSYGCRPFGIIENVITRDDYRKNGLATILVKEGIAISRKWNCYKVILETSSKEEWKLKFYEKCGLDYGEKTAFIKRFD